MGADNLRGGRVWLSDVVPSRRGGGGSVRSLKTERTAGPALIFPPCSIREQTDLGVKKFSRPFSLPSVKSTSGPLNPRDCVNNSGQPVDDWNSPRRPPDDQKPRPIEFEITRRANERKTGASRIRKSS